MSGNQNEYSGEKGNAVALTLLGLAVAILAGVAVLYVIGSAKSQPVLTPQPAPEAVQEEVTVNPREGWLVFEDEQYGFHIEFPQGWVVATGTLSTGEPVMSVSQGVGTTSPGVYGLEEVVSHVSIYPLGVGDIESAIPDTTKSSNVIIAVPQASAIDYVLKSGKPWATKAVFEEYPESWSEEGFVFARIVVEEETLTYMRGEKQIAEIEYDSASGDVVERSGFLDSKLRETQEEILRSFSFSSPAEKQGGEGTTSPFASIETPFINEVVFSPFTVRGTVVGKWYSEEELSIRLETSSGEVLTEVPVVLGEWNSQETLPFEVSLAFDSTTATSGNIILSNQKTAESVSTTSTTMTIPVLFTQ